MARVQGMTPEGIRKAIAEAISFIKDLNVEDLNKLLAAFEDANGIFDVRLVEAREEVKKAGEKALEAETQARLIIEELARHQELQDAETDRILDEVAVAIEAANLASDRIPSLLERLATTEQGLLFANTEFDTLIVKQDEFLDTVAEQTAEVARLNTEFVAVNQAAADAVEKVDQSTIKVNQISGDLELAKATLDAKIKQNQEDITEAQKVADEHQNAIETLTGNLDGLTTDYSNLSSNFSTEVEKLEAADASLLSNMNTKVGALNTTTAAQATAIAEAKAQADKGVSDASAASLALSNYKTVNDPKVSQAQKDAAKGIEDASAALTRANTAAGQLPAMNTAISNAAAAAKKANDALPAIRTDITNISTKVSTATGNLSNLESDVASKVAALQAMDQAQAGEISDTNSKIDNLQIGGRNLLFKSSEWKFTSSDNAATVDRAELGKIKVLLAGSSWNAYQWIAGFVDEDSFFDGKSTYTISVELRVTSPGGGEAEMSFDVRVPGGSIKKIVRSDRISDTQGKWVRASATITLPDVEERRALFALRAYGTIPGDLVEYRNVKIERGNRATDWIPAPEDVDAGIAKAQLEAETARAEAETKSNAARVAAELAAKEMADQAQADAEVEAARAALEIAQKEAKAAKDAAAVDATQKANAAQTAAETLAKAEAKAAKETAEANAALDATNKANKAKTDAEAKAATLATAAKDAAAAALNTYKGINDPKVTKAQTDATKAIGDAKAAADKLPAMVTATSNAAAAAKKANDALPAIRTDITNISTKVSTATGNLTTLQTEVNSKVAALQAMDQTQAGEISTTNSKIDNLQIGGRNLMRYSGGEVLRTVGLGYAPAIVTEDGKKALAFNSSNNIIYLGHGAAPVIKAGEQITFSFWAKASKDLRLGRVYLGPGVGNSGFLSNETITTEWKRFSFTHTPTEDMSLNVHMYPAIVNEDGTYETFYVTEWKLERGSKATDWTMAPEDVDAGIKTALDEAKSATGALPAINSSLSDVSTKANQAVAALPGLSDGIAKAQSDIDNFQIGGRNYLLKTGKTVPFAITSNHGGEYPRQLGSDEVGSWIRGWHNTLDVWFLSTYINPTFVSGYGSYYSPDLKTVTGQMTQSVEVMCLEESPLRISLYGVGEHKPLIPGQWIKLTKTFDDFSKMDRLSGLTSRSDSAEGVPAEVKLYHRNWKLEVGNKATDWTPAPEDIQTQVDSLNTKAAELTTGLSNAATQEQYNTLNTRLWGNQGEINTINATFQAQQKQINDNNTAFQTWQTDINTKRGKWENGATLALQHLTDFTTRQTKWNKASTDATKALSDAAAAQKDFNDNQTKWNLASTNATKALADLTTEQGKVLALQTELNTKRDRWENGATLAIDNLTNFSVRQTKWNKASTDATNALANAATAQKAFNDNQTKWNLASTNATKALADLTTEQGKVLALQTELNTKRDRWENGATLAIDNLTNFSARQTKWNKASTDATNALSDAAAATNQALAAHQRLIEMVYPDQLSLVPMVPGGVNTGTSAKPVYRQEPSWRNGATTTTVVGTPDMTDKVAATYSVYKAYSTTTKNTVPVRTQDVGFSVWVNASAVNSHMIFTLADDTDTRCVQKTVIKEGPAAGTHVGYVFDTRKTGTLPVGWTKIEGVITLKPGVKAIRTENIYFNYPNTGSSTATQYFTDLKMWPIIPAQADVNEALTKAVDSHAALFEGQNKWNEVASAAIQSQATLLAKQDRWSDGVNKALAWQDQLNNAQSDINKTTKSVLANQAKWNSAQAIVNDSQSNINKATKLVLDNQAKWNSAQEKVNNDQSELNKAVKLVQDKQIAWSDGVTKALASHDELFTKTSDTFKAVKEVNTNQGKWNTAVSDLITTNKNVTAANKTAIEGLTRVLGLTNSSSNVVPMVPGGVRTGGTDIAPVFTPTPSWMTKGTRVTVTDIPEITSIDAIQQTGQATSQFEPYYSEVDPTIEYKYSYWAKANVTGTRMYIELKSGESTAFPIQSNTQDNHSSAGQYLAGNVLLAVGWKQYTGTIRFKPDVRTVYFNRVYYNHPNGVAGTQTLADIQIYPNIPSQADVNKALTDSDAAQTTLLAKYGEWSDAASRSIATVESLWGKTEADVGELNTLTEELGDRITKQGDDFAKSVSEMFTNIPRVAYAQDGESVPASDTDGFIKIIRYTSGNRATRTDVEAVGNWVGSMIVEGDHGKSDGFNKTFMNYTPIRKKFDVLSGTRLFKMWRNTDVDHIGAVKVTYFVKPGRVVPLYPSGGETYPDQDKWKVLFSEVAPETTDYNISLNVTWAATTYNDQYGVRIRVGSNTVAEIKKDRVGPLLPGQGGVRVMSISKSQVRVPSGTRIYLEAYANAGGTLQRRITKWSGQMSYITSGRG